MFSDKLKELRNSRGYSLDRLAETYNIRFNGRLNKSTLSRYENGTQEPLFTVVRNLAKLFGVTVDTLIDDNTSNDGQKNIPQSEDILTADEKQLIDTYRNFNDEGKEKLRDTASDMAQLDRYKKCGESNVVSKEA